MDNSMADKSIVHHREYEDCKEEEYSEIISKYKELEAKCDKILEKLRKKI